MPQYSIDGQVQRIDYLSSLPGGGKTTWAIRQIASRIRSGTGVTIYTGPTHKLLEEIRIKIQTELEPELHHRIIKLDDGLRTSLGLTTLKATARVLMKAVRRPVSVNGITVPQLEPGTVIMMAHQTFLRLDSGYSDEGKSLLPNRKRVHVIFDEAQKCALNPSQMSLSPELVAILSKFLPLDELHEANTPIEIKSKLTKRELDTALQLYAKDNKLTDSVSRMFTSMKMVMEHVYGQSIRVLGMARLNPKSATLQLHAVLDPARVFYGWKSVTLMAARLENSQMYHMLRLSTYSQLTGEDEDMFERRIQDIECPIELREKMVPEIAVQERALKRTWSNAFITWASGGQSKLSMELLDNGVVIKPDPGESFDLWLAGLKRVNIESGARLQSGILKTLVRQVSGIPGNGHLMLDNRELVDYIKTLPNPLPYTPIQYLLKRSVDINRAWNKAQGNYEPTPLLATINVGDGKFEKDVQAMNYTEDDIILVPFMSQGSNEYIEHHVFAFLASVNPHPGSKTAMETLCPDYNSDLDHLVDQAVQSLTRSSIRVPEVDAFRLMILPDEESARNVWKHGFSGYPALIAPEKIGDIGIGNGLTKKDARDLADAHSIAALRVQSKAREVRETVKRRSDKQKLKKRFLKQHIPEYGELDKIKRKLREKRPSHDPERLRADLKALESSIADQIRLYEVQFERRWRAGEFVKPEL